MPDSGSGVIAPINMQDPQALMSVLSPDELSCILQNADPQVLQKLLSAPDTATPEEAEGFITCVENEALLTFFLVPFTSQIGALSEETSACLRGGFEGIDLRALMLGSFASPDDEAAMISGMTGFIVTLSCLNQEEWELGQPGPGIGSVQPGGSPVRVGQTWRAGRLGRHDEPRRRPAHCPVRRCGRVQPGICGRAAGATTRANCHIRSGPHCDAGNAGFRGWSHRSSEHAGPAGAHVRAVAG